jgi:hypothetical protein
MRLNCCHRESTEPIALSSLERLAMRYVRSYTKKNRIDCDDVFVDCCGSSVTAIDILCSLGDHFNIRVPYYHILCEKGLTLRKLLKIVHEIMVTERYTRGEV